MQNKEKKYHVTLASDSNYIEFVATVLVSLFKNNPDASIAVHLLANALSGDDVCRVQKHIPQERGELFVYPIDNFEERFKVGVKATIAITSYARLFLPAILPVDVERVLYVDCDVLFTSPIDEFYNVDFGDSLVAGALDTLADDTAKVAIGCSACEPYLNAGVLMIPLDKWRKENVQQQFVDFLVARNGNVRHNDQGIINAVCKGRKLVVAPRYNVNSNFFSHPYTLLKESNTPFCSLQEYEEAKALPAIIHFTEGFLNRPWIANSLHPYRNEYLGYRALTMWKDTPLRCDRRSVAAKSLAYVFLNFPYAVYRLYSTLLGALSRIKRKNA